MPQEKEWWDNGIFKGDLKEEVRNLIAEAQRREREEIKSDHRQGRHVLHDENRDASQSKSERSGWNGGTREIDGTTSDPTSQRIGGSTSQECGAQERIMEPSESEGREIRREGQGCFGDTHTNATGKRLEKRKTKYDSRLLCAIGDDRSGISTREAWRENWVEVATRLCTLDDGLPDGLARPKGWRNAAIKGAGNAIVPAVAEQIFRAIKEMEYAK